MAKTTFTPTPKHTLDAIHHVVHDYSELVSSGTIVKNQQHGDYRLQPPMNSHLQTAFLINCRKFYDFFAKPLDQRYMDNVLAADFTKTGTMFSLPTYEAWGKHMNQHLLHIAHSRSTNTTPWNGHAENEEFLNEFKAAWKQMLADLDTPYAAGFTKEIEQRKKSKGYEATDW